jgi:hypothetical protein
VSWYSNFFYGNDPSKWRSYVSNYQEVYYENLYDGIDLRYYTNENGLKYDFIIKPGADVEQIRVRYEGAEHIELDEDENLKIITALGEITDGDLFIYQESESSRNKVKGQFKIYDDCEYGFEIIGDYNPQKILVIDPFLTFSTFLGASHSDNAQKIRVDDSGNSYISGWTLSDDFPTTPGANDTSFNGGWTLTTRYDVFITKLNPDGSSLVFSTYIGGNHRDYGNDIDLDLQKNIYCTGYTFSSNFPNTTSANDTVFNGGTDAFILKLDSTGSLLVYSTFVGGIAGELGEAIVVNSNGNAFITGHTTSTDFPTTPGANQTTKSNSDEIFIVKLSTDGSTLEYSTYLGGDHVDEAYSITIDMSGNAYVTGFTMSTDFPVTGSALSSSKSGNGDMFITKINPTGSTLLYSTYINSFGFFDEGFGIALDNDRNVYITGKSSTFDFPLPQNAYDKDFNGGGYDSFALKMNITQSQIIYCTYLGGTDVDYGKDIRIDSNGCAYIAGYTESNDFPTTMNALNGTYMGSNTDGFLVKINPDGSDLLYSTFIGGIYDDRVYGVDLLSDNNIFITGHTASPNLPTTPGAYTISKVNGTDSFVMRFDFNEIVNVTSIKLFSDGNEISQVYSQYKTYSFQINISDSMEQYEDLQTVMLILDPLSANIQLLWNRSSGLFNEYRDPNDYIELSSTSTALNNTNLNWTINFNLTFNWNYPNEDLNDIQVQTSGIFIQPNSFNFTDVFKLENDLAFAGSLLVTNKDDRDLINNQLVRGGGSLRWSGLTVVYENTTDIYPPADEYNVEIWDDSGNNWISDPEEGKAFYYVTPVGADTNENGEVYTINITGIPPESDTTNVSFKIRIDNDTVEFSDHSPLETVWHTTSSLSPGITITDVGGAMVNGSRMMRTISTDNGTSWSEWTVVESQESSESIIVEETIEFPDGSDNFIKWLAWDTVENGPAESRPYKILVDSEGVRFSENWPLADVESPTEDVQVGITISDNISAINSSTIEYSISIDSGNSWSSWKPVTGFQNGFSVNTYVTETFQDGTGNRIKWRATDIAGNGPAESPAFQISVNTLLAALLEVNLISPLNGSIVNGTGIDLKWELVSSSLAGITYDVYFGEIPYPELYREGVTETTSKVSDLQSGKMYFWQVIPNASGVLGICKSGIWEFIYMSGPEGSHNIKIDGVESITMFQEESKTIELTITNLGTRTDSVDLSIEDSKISKYMSFDDFYIINLESMHSVKRNLVITISNLVEPGNYYINLTAVSKGSGGAVKDVHSIDVEIKAKDVIEPDNGDDKSDPESKSSNNLANIMYILIVVLIAVIIMFIMIRLKNRKELKEKLDKTSDTEASYVETKKPPDLTAGLPAESTTVTPDQLQVIPSAAAGAAGAQPQPAAVPVTAVAAASPPSEEPAPQLPAPAEPEEAPEQEPVAEKPEPDMEQAQEPEPEPEIKTETHAEPKVDELFDLPIAGYTKPVPKKSEPVVESENTETDQRTNESDN